MRTSKTPIGGVGIFIKGTDGIPRLRVIHGIRKYPGPLLATSQLSGKVFGFYGEVNRLGFVAISQIVEGMFAVTGNVNVYNVAQHKATLVADPFIVTVPTLVDTEPQTETISMQKTAYIPFDLMALLLEEPLTARDAFLNNIVSHCVYSRYQGLNLGH